MEWQPHVLLGPGQVAACYDELFAAIQAGEVQAFPRPADAAFVGRVLGLLLRMRQSIVDRTAVATFVQDGLSAGREPDEIGEDVVVAIQPRAVEIQLPRDYFREITLAETADRHDEFVVWRDRLFYELGVYYPDFRFVMVDELKPSSFRFQLGPLATLPRPGLHPNELLVNETAERLLELLNIHGEPAINPADLSLCSIINAERRGDAEKAGLATWSPIGYVVLSLAGELRKESWRFVTSDFVENQVASLGKGFPALTQAARSRFTTGQITRTLRSLIAEDISIRNLRAIFELLVHFDTIVADASKYIILDDRLPVSKPPQGSWQERVENLTAAVRSGLKREITYKYTKGRDTIVVYLLDWEIETELSDRPAPAVEEEVTTFPDEDQRSRILKAVREELRMVSRSGEIPAILTNIEVRPILRDLLKDEFPTVPVIAYQELSPHTKIQPIARISFG